MEFHDDFIINWTSFDQFTTRLFIINWTSFDQFMTRLFIILINWTSFDKFMTRLSVCSVLKISMHSILLMQHKG